MQTLALSVELSQLAMEHSNQPTESNFLLRKIERLLKGHASTLGRFVGKTQAKKRQLGKDLALREIQFDFEKHSLQLRLVHFLPRANWEIQSFQFV